MARGKEKKKISEERRDAGEAAIIAVEKTIKFLVTDYTIEHLANKV
jgi:hypothetical protein